MGILAAFPVDGPSDGKFIMSLQSSRLPKCESFDERHFAEERIRASSLCVFTRPSHSLLRDAKRGFFSLGKTSGRRGGSR